MEEQGLRDLRMSPPLQTFLPTWEKEHTNSLCVTKTIIIKDTNHQQSSWALCVGATTRCWMRVE